MAKKKKRHYYILLCAGQVYIFLTLASAQVEGYYLLKGLIGDAERAREIIESMDKNLQTPPYPSKKPPALDMNEINTIINNIALGI